MRKDKRYKTSRGEERSERMGRDGRQMNREERCEGEIKE